MQELVQRMVQRTVRAEGLVINFVAQADLANAVEVGGAIRQILIAHTLLIGGSFFVALRIPQRNIGREGKCFLRHIGNLKNEHVMATRAQGAELGLYDRQGVEEIAD